MNRLKTRTILCLSVMTCILLVVPSWSTPGQNQSSAYLQYRDKLDKLKTLAEAKMKIVRDQANQKFLGLGKELDTLSPEQMGAWLRDHRSEETRAAQIWNESATLRNTIYKEYCAERERLENVYRAGGLGKVGYVFIGDVEYNWERRKLEAWHAGLQNLITLGWLTGNQVSKLDDFEPLIRQKEQILGQKFETIITVYLARGEDLTKALEGSKMAGYIWISHGGKDKRDLYDDNGDPVNADTLRPLVEAARNRYIMKALPPHLAKLYEETQSSDQDVKEAAGEQILALKGEDLELWDYVRSEALKVNLGLSYVEHFACLSGADGAQRFANTLMGEDGVFIGYEGVVDYTGKSGRVTFKGLTSAPTKFKSQNTPDPDPRQTVRNKRAKTVTTEGNKDEDKKGDDKKKEPTQPSSPTNPGAARFSGTVPDNWEGGNTPQGFVLKRKLAKIKGPCGKDSSVTASISATFAQTAKLKDAAEALAIANTRFKAGRQGDTPNDMAVGLKMVGGHEGVGGFSMGDYKGAIADFALWMRRGSWGAGFTGSYFGSNGIGDVVKQGGVISFSYHVSGGGCWDNSDHPYLIAQGIAAQEEARAILASLQLDDKGLIVSKPYDGPKYDGSDLPRVVLVPSKIEKLKPGDVVKIEAVVENAKPEDSPFSYNWGGTFDGTPETSKKSNTVRIKPTKPGKYSVSVSVDGARFGLGSASVDYIVVDYRVKIERDQPVNTPLVVGSKTGFKATLSVDGASPAGTFIYRWEPSTELNWSTLDSQQPRSTAIFTKSGTTKVWVVVLEKRGEVLSTVAESDQLALDVVNPAL